MVVLKLIGHHVLGHPEGVQHTAQVQMLNWLRHSFQLWHSRAQQGGSWISIVTSGPGNTVSTVMHHLLTPATLCLSATTAACIMSITPYALLFIVSSDELPAPLAPPPSTRRFADLHPYAVMLVPKLVTEAGQACEEL